MKDIYRQLLAGAAASTAFLAIFFGIKLVWWVSLALSLGVYSAAILAVPRLKEAYEIEVDVGITQADVNAAVELCLKGALELRKRSETPMLSPEMEKALSRLAELTENIGQYYTKDPRSLRPSRGLIDNHLAKLVKIVEIYCELCCQPLTAEANGRLEDSRNAIIGYVPSFEAIYNACLESNFQELEIQTSAFGQILKAEAPADMMAQRRKLCANGSD